jgi:hypothetical protein
MKNYFDESDYSVVISGNDDTATALEGGCNEFVY